MSAYEKLSDMIYEGVQMNSDGLFGGFSDIIDGGVRFGKHSKSSGAASGIISVLTCTPVKAIMGVLLCMLVVMCLHRLVHGHIIPSMSDILICCCCFSLTISAVAGICYFDSMYAWVCVCLSACAACIWSVKTLF